MLEESQENQMVYGIDTFGYGKNHDEEVLQKMSDFKNGTFYYI